MKKLKIFGMIISLVLIFILSLLLMMYQIGKGGSINSEYESGKTITVSGLEFDLFTAGNPKGTPIIMLHGFPESVDLWSKLMNDTAFKDYYCIAFNQRGYSFGAQPKDVASYKIDSLVDDVIAIANKLEVDAFHLIGHDWGGAIGWEVAARFPDRVKSFSALSVPTINAWSKAYRENSKQYEASDYIRIFQNPILPEFFLAKGGYKNLKSLWSKHSEREISNYLKIFSQKHTLKSTLNWYRANFNSIENGPLKKRITVPSLYIWGKHDTAILRSAAIANAEFVSGFYKVVEIDAGHWLLQESFDRVSKEIANHISMFESIK